ncbi:hypothetical protein JCM17844_28690 [Iodidimonas gelatinilytica]|uniref:Uncharacterized protein n=1 Tax=Iodidimonas gelatinilytica TaxID=1236966 RepID=A0A5A7MT59_9PROT|nr:hypothetical protein JCM17844_28690 [Iodidimonas gelatinilytica]
MWRAGYQQHIAGGQGHFGKTPLETSTASCRGKQINAPAARQIQRGGRAAESYGFGNDEYFPQFPPFWKMVAVGQSQIASADDFLQEIDLALNLKCVARFKLYVGLTGEDKVAVSYNAINVQTGHCFDPTQIVPD